MIFTQLDLILILCSFGTIYAKYNETFSNILTYTAKNSKESLVHVVENLFNALKKTGTTLNDIESHKAAVQLLIELSHALETPSKEDFCDEYSFIEKNLDGFLDDAISQNLDLIMRAVYDEKVESDLEVSITLALKCEQYNQNMPLTDQVKELMDIVEEVDITADTSYHENPILKTIPEHVLRTISFFFKLMKVGAPVIQESWNEDIDDITNIQRPWIIQSNDQTHLELLFEKIENLIEKPDNKLDDIYTDLKNSASPEGHISDEL